MTAYHLPRNIRTQLVRAKPPQIFVTPTARDKNKASTKKYSLRFVPTMPSFGTHPVWRNGNHCVPVIFCCCRYYFVFYNGNKEKNFSFFLFCLGHKRRQGEGLLLFQDPNLGGGFCAASFRIQRSRPRDKLPGWWPLLLVTFVWRYILLAYFSFWGRIWYTLFKCSVEMFSCRYKVAGRRYCNSRNTLYPWIFILQNKYSRLKKNVHHTFTLMRLD